MEKFVPRFQGAPWPDGARVLHVYAVPDVRSNGPLARLVGACRSAMSSYPITPIGDDTLHCTVEMIADTTADRITADERDDLVAALRKHVAATGPLEVTAGSPIANRFGAFLDLSPDDGLVELRERVRDAIREVRGPGALLHNGGRHHISLGYAWAEASSDALQTALRSLAPSHARLRFTGLRLLDVQFRLSPRPDGESAWELSWEPVADIPLAGGSGDTPPSRTAG
ncbi:hypothetical protein ACFWOG_39055 [Kitasatospora sp. NPDC058406]|uniref:hypothetical protein n=1 Tax=Kitasatospora sp. NPDC058406 TaxID=3346483 RepID=UPI00365EBAC9